MKSRLLFPTILAIGRPSNPIANKVGPREFATGTRMVMSFVVGGVTASRSALHPSATHLSDRAIVRALGESAHGIRRRGFRPGPTFVRPQRLQRPPASLRPALRRSTRRRSPEEGGNRLDRGDSDPGYAL